MEDFSNIRNAIKIKKNNDETLILTKCVPSSTAK